MKNQILEVSDFYDEMGEHYDEFMEKGKTRIEDKLNLVRQFVPENSLILDIGCGTGKTSLSLVERGFNVVGLDISSKMVKIARESGLKHVILGDIRRLDLGNKKYDAVISLCTGFSYFSDESDLIKVSRKLYNAIKVEGILIWDTPNKNYYGEEYLLEWPSGSKIVRTRCYGHSKEHLEEIFKSSGFLLQNVFGKYTPLKEYTPELPRIIMVAKR